MPANISSNNILVGQAVSAWQETIQTAATPLVTSKSITEEYIHQIIKSVDKLGPYIVLMPGFALVYALPGNFVLHTDVSTATFREPINFHSENGPVSVVIYLACTDRTSHIEQPQVIAEKLMESSSIDKIAACKNREELSSLFRK